MKRAGWALPVLVLALGGCIARSNDALLPPPESVLPPARWWTGLNDPQLSALIQRGLARTSAPLAASPQNRACDIARDYIALRARQSALVLLAEREDLDDQSLTIARQRGTVSRQAVEAAQGQLAATRADQAQARAEVAVLRDRLAALTGAADSLPGGAMPRPPAQPVAGDPAALRELRRAERKRAAVHGTSRDAARAALRDAKSALGRYGVAQVAAGLALSRAEHASAMAALQTINARAGTSPAADAIAADRQALDALQAEEQARAAMTQAYVALARSLASGFADLTTASRRRGLKRRIKDLESGAGAPDPNLFGVVPSAGAAKSQRRRLL